MFNFYVSILFQIYEETFWYFDAQKLPMQSYQIKWKTRLSSFQVSLVLY